MAFYASVGLSKLFDEKYEEYINKVINYFRHGDKIKKRDIYDVLKNDVQICSKVKTLSSETLKSICDFIYNVVNLENDSEELIKYLYNFNYVIRDIDEYRLVNSLDCEELKNLTNYEFAALKGLFFLFKKALYDISSLNKSKDYINLPIDALMVSKGAYLKVNKDNIIMEEIINSSYGKSMKITFKQLEGSSFQKLLELHQKCKDYANASIANGIFNAPINHSIIEGIDTSYLVRKVDNNDIDARAVDLNKKRFALNCSIITKRTPNLYPDLYDDIVLGYSNIKNNEILFISPYDAYTDELHSLHGVTNMTETNNMFLSLDELNQRTYLNSGGYNEIVILRNGTLNPSYILERNGCSKKFIDIAREKNIPFITLKTARFAVDKDALLNVGIKYGGPKLM